MKTIVVLTGAGISAESGIKTFRDSDGLWENYDVMEVASVDGWKKNPKLVLDFYNQRRQQLKTVKPNAAHLALVELEKHYKVYIITQNVDDLHERANSKDILHLHGELRKVRSSKNESLIYDCEKDIHWGDTAEDGGQLRPHIVWFGEEVPMFPLAAAITELADILLVIGTSMQVYPAASLATFSPPNTPIYYIDLNPVQESTLASFSHLKVVAAPATIGVRQVVDELLR